LCRLWATELSEVKPQLDAHNIRLCGVGLEELGLKEFQEGGYFTGDLFVDIDKKSFKDLEFRRYNAVTILGGLAAKETRQALSKSNARGIKGNFQGDGMQTGGLLIVSAGGDKVIFSHKQTSPGDHVPAETILKALDIPQETADTGATP